MDGISHRPSRREFLHALAAGVVTFRAPGGERRHGLPRITGLSENLGVYRGPIHIGIVRAGTKTLLIDAGDRSLDSRLRMAGVRSIDRVLFTHHHRDQAFGAHTLAARGAGIGVPAAERAYFDDVAAYWNRPESRWHLYNLHPHHLMLAEPVRVDFTVAGGDVFTWGPARIRVLATPGHTDGSVSYVVEVDGRRVVFCGDAIYDEGQVWEIHSLQKGTQTTDYHGFLGARPQLVESLKRIEAAGPDILVPSHGEIMRNPSKAIAALVRRLDRCYEKYVAISSLRHYFPHMFTEYAGREGQMPIRKGKAPPPCLRHFGTSWVIVSKTRAAFVMDCGNRRVIESLKGLIEKGEIRAVEGLWVTHYHDDHVDAIPEFQKMFDCPCITDRHVACVISDPKAWRLPCISPNKARVDRATEDGETWMWHEFTMTAYHFPGQTLYHAGLLVEGLGVRMLFVGDSFTMGGIDDYCSSNRNWLGRGVGFDRCVALIEELEPTHIFNCHVNEAFDFTPEQCRFMRANLAEREALFGALVPWDHANYGMDEPWVRCHPYEQEAAPGDEGEIKVVVTNHSADPRRAECFAVLPRAWGNDPLRERPIVRAGSGFDVPAKRETELPPLAFRVPSGTKPGRYVIPIHLRYGERELPQFTEAIVVVTDRAGGSAGGAESRPAGEEGGGEGET